MRGLVNVRWVLPLLLVACSGGGKALVKGPCARGELQACGTACNDTDKPCASGLYCEALACTAACTSGSALVDCADDEVCSADGHCVLDPQAASGQGTNGRGDGGLPSNLCAEVKLDATPKTPNVILVVDQSSSMEEDFGSNGSRWDALKRALLADDGLIAELESVVRFGLVLYSAEEDNATCPLLTEVSLALDNFDAIRDTYQPADMIADTPTGDALNALLDRLQGAPDVTSDDPTIFVLATDGAPDSCARLNPNDGTADPEAVAAVERAYSLGIRTFVIAVAEENELPQAHVRDLANAGVGGAQGGQDAPSYRVRDDRGLRDALRGIVGGELSCTVPLKGKVVTEDPCVGSVRLGGEPLGCNAPNGWRLVDESTIEIQGSACATLKTGKLLEASFPCDTAIVI
jgi:hypothetical protein